MKALFQNRREAGRTLARYLPAYHRQPHCRVLGLARGGMPVAYEVALALDLPLDVFTVRRLCVPGDERRIMGAIASGGVRVLNEDVLTGLRDASQILAEVSRREHAELHRQEKLYRGSRAFRSLSHFTTLLIDDGLTTGATMKAAIKALRLAKAERCVIAVPVCAGDSLREFEAETDDIIFSHRPQPASSEEAFYADFSPVTDEEVCALLEAAARRK